MRKHKYLLLVGAIFVVSGLFSISAVSGYAQSNSSLQQLLNKPSQIQQQNRPSSERETRNAPLQNGLSSPSAQSQINLQEKTSSNDQVNTSENNEASQMQSPQSSSTPSGISLSREQLLKRGDNIQDKLLKNPSNQKGLNKLIDSYVKKNYSDLFYTKNSSRGEIKILLQSQRLYQNNTLNFVVVPEHVNKALDFKNASYTWEVKRGDKVVKTRNGNDKTLFNFTPQNTGPYIVHVNVQFPNNVTKTGRFPLNIYERTNIDYRPVNPGKGDSITLRPVRRFQDQQIIWKIDGSVFARNTYNPSFREFKGYGGSYNVEVLFKDKKTDTITHYGETTIKVKKPHINLQAYNNQTKQRYELKKSLSLSKSQSLTVNARARSFPKDKSLTYIFRINNDIKQKGPKSQYNLDVSSKEKLKLSVSVQAGEDGTVAQKQVMFNPNQTDDMLSASLNEKTPDWSHFPMRDFVVMITVFGLGVVLMRIQ